MANPFKIHIFNNNKNKLSFTNGSHIICTICGNKDVWLQEWTYRKSSAESIIIT